MDGEVRVQRAQGYSAVHSGKIMSTQAIKVIDTCSGAKIFFEQMSIFLIDAITCNEMDLSEAEGQLRTSTFEEKHIYSYWFPLIYLQHSAES